MGLLAETKIKRKLQQDPNNTKWTRNENTFGQKILRSHGWQPGQYLGVQDAPHSEMYTAANASFIRVAMKDDMKGLGFDKAMKDDEITGLDVFTDLLSRLNGKSEELVQEEKQARLVVKTHRFVEQRYGAMRFVRGGLLVGDELKADVNSPKVANEEEEEKEEKEKEKKTSKKRKAISADEDDNNSSPAVESEAKKKRKKSIKKRSADVSSDDTHSTETDTKAKRKEKRSKKDKLRKDTIEGDTDSAVAKPTSTDQADELEPSKSKKSKEERKEEKRLKKQRKEEKKEAKRRKKAEAKAQQSSSSKSSSPDPTSTVEVTTTTTTTEATPAGSGTSTPRGNPHFVRSRFLKAKREAMLDSNAINKIFMVKA